ncbi:MAG: GNAT family N-acetyltransferase [Polyangiales bacterium]
MTSAWQLSTDPDWLELERVHGWLATTYWSPNIRLEVVREAFTNSLFIGAYTDARETIGIARVVTDRATFAWLCDVFVAEAYRKRGVARAMVAALLADARLTTVRRWCLSTRDAHAVYRPLGFEAVPADTWLERRSPASVWQAAAVSDK